MLLPLPRRVPGPSAVINLTRSAVDHAVDSATAMAGLPVRAFGLLDGAEHVLTRVSGMVDRVEALLARVERIAADAEAAVARVQTIAGTVTAPIEEITRLTNTAATLVTEVQRVADNAAGTMKKAEPLVDSAARLLGTYEPALRKGAPMVHRFVDQLTNEEVDAAIKLVDEVPTLSEHLIDDVLPILTTLDRVGPDIHELLNVTRDVHQALSGIPWLRLLRHRGEHEPESADAPADRP